MAEKEFTNVRIGLKLDQLSVWQEKDTVLKRGEVAFCTVASGATEGGVSEPVIMAKIGNGTSSFNKLNWNFYAKASDVHSWAKKSETQFVEWVKDLIDLGDLDMSGYYTKVEVDALLKAITDTVSGIAGRVGALESKYDVDEALSVVISELEGKIALKADKTALEAEVKRATEAEATLSGEIAKKADQSAVDAMYTNAKIDELVAGAKTHADTEIGKLDIVFDASYGNSASEIVTGVTLKLGEEPIGMTDYVLAQATGEYSLASNPIALKDYVDAAEQAAKAYADANDANTEYHVEYDSTNKKIKLVAGADASKMEIDATDFVKDGMISSVALSEDGKSLIITWNTDAGKDAVTLPLSGLVDVYTGVDGTTVKVEVSSDNKISAEVKEASIENKHIKDATIEKAKLSASVQESLGKADTALQSHQSLDHLATKTELGNVDKKFENVYTKEAVDGLIAPLAVAETVASDIAASEGRSAALVQGLADGAVADNAAAIKTINQTIGGYGDIVSRNASEFATSAQGAKADTAVQTITAASGLSATLKQTGEYEIGFDSAVTFFFNCGGAE